MHKGMRSLLVGMLVVGVVACVRAEPPRGFALAVSDTARVTVACPVAGPNTGCLVSVADSISGQVVWANQAIPVGQEVSTLFAGVPGQRVVLKGTMVGVAPNVPNSAPVFARAEGTFPFPGAQPPTFVIQFVIPPRP